MFVRVSVFMAGLSSALSASPFVWLLIFVYLSSSSLPLCLSDMPLQTSLALWIAVISAIAGLAYYMHWKYMRSEAPTDLSVFTNMKFWISTRAVCNVVTLILIRSLVTLGPHLTIVLLGILQVQ